MPIFLKDECMTTTNKETITVATTVNASLEKVWTVWNAPEHITKWNSGSDDWHTPYAENDLRIGGRFHVRMEAKDGSAGFDFIGTYNEVKKNTMIAYTIEGGRYVKITFTGEGKTVKISETFDPENENSLELQRSGWQKILDNFKRHVESVQ